MKGVMHQEEGHLWAQGQREAWVTGLGTGGGPGLVSVLREESPGRNPREGTESGVNWIGTGCPGLQETVFWIKAEKTGFLTFCSRAKNMTTFVTFAHFCPIPRRFLGSSGQNNPELRKNRVQKDGIWPGTPALAGLNLAKVIKRAKVTILVLLSCSQAGIPGTSELSEPGLYAASRRSELHIYS